MKPWMVKTALLIGLSGMALVVMVHDYSENRRNADIQIPAPDEMVYPSESPSPTPSSTPTPSPVLIPSPSPTPFPTTYSIQGVRERDRERFGDDD